MDDLRKYSPTFSHVKDCVAFVVHLSFLKLGCKLVGLREDQYLEDIGSIPQGWNESSEMYTFKYAFKEPKAESSSSASAVSSTARESVILVRVISTDDNELIVSAIREGSDSVLTLDLTVSDHISVASDGSLTDFAAVFRDIDGLLLLINERITYKVIPQIQKKKTEEDRSGVAIVGVPSPARRRPVPLGPFGGGVPVPGVGGDFGGDFSPFGGVGIGGVGIGGGSLMGPRHPRFDPSAGSGAMPGDLRRPDGARFDPFGPGPLGGIPGPGPDGMPRPGSRDQEFGFGSGRGDRTGAGRGSGGGPFGGYGGGFGGFDL